VLTINAPRLAGDVRASHFLRATGDLVLNPLAGAPAGSAGAGAAFDLAGESVSISTLIDAPAGSIAVSATGAGTGDGVTLGPGGALRARGFARSFDDQVVALDGGRVTLRAATGDVTAAAGSLIDVDGAAGGRAGSVSVVAGNGQSHGSKPISALPATSERSIPRSTRAAFGRCAGSGFAAAT
jgi:hypothetical protein